ncbi:sigma-54 dependent transcriptional regulator [Oxalobacteraceae bacterium R-40]|uniref:Sigma-54 dependent transcriptional regulator n=1 Tax=Keguizhuia sedimenti TaxID=3064264 RepID=A0ABU1BTI6_9BURK|nr:sigma-54 dependent transcriptional regulator [Oxalobacteraceae bacterium R-40]
MNHEMNTYHGTAMARVEAPNSDSIGNNGNPLSGITTESQPILCGELFGASHAMQGLFHLIEKVAPTRASVLISGESGTGKELAACAIHEKSMMKEKPFIALNCGAVSPHLIEAELFGHERGSFTGAVRTHKGCFERANGGTLFLDELTEMSADMQIKLLRVLETGRFCRVGADEELHVKVRVIAATNRDPRQAMDSGMLRSDLFYRLAVFPIAVPALRDREDDVELLAELFLERLNEEEGENKAFSRTSRRFLHDYHWPGNVRELKNTVYRAFILSDHELDLAAAAGPIRPVVAPMESDCISFPLGSRLADAEQRLIFATLGYCGGNKTQTAEVLGISLKTLYNRLNEYQSKVLINDPTVPQSPCGTNFGV